MSLEIVSTGAVLGAEIRGIDLSQPLGDNAFAEIEHTYNQHGVIFFRNQRITPEQQVAFTRWHDPRAAEGDLGGNPARRIGRRRLTGGQSRQCVSEETVANCPPTRARAEAVTRPPDRRRERLNSTQDGASYQTPEAFAAC